MSLCVHIVKDNFSSFKGEMNKKEVLLSLTKWGPCTKNAGSPAKRQMNSCFHSASCLELQDSLIWSKLVSILPANSKRQNSTDIDGIKQDVVLLPWTTLNRGPVGTSLNGLNEWDTACIKNGLASNPQSSQTTSLQTNPMLIIQKETLCLNSNYHLHCNHRAFSLQLILGSKW